MMFNNFFIHELGFDDLKTDLPEEIRNKGLDGLKVHYTDNVPAIFFKEVANFQFDTLIEISELQKKIWNNSSVIFLYVVSPTEIRIYNCNDTPRWYIPDENASELLNKNLSPKLIEHCTINDKEKLDKLINVFSSHAIDCGNIWKTSYKYSKKIKLQTKVDNYLVKSLLSLAEILNKDIEDKNIIHNLLMRSIFIMYLQDRNAIPKEIWNEVDDTNFLNILNDHNKTYRIFKIISSKFNGNAFPILSNEENQVSTLHLKYLKNCLCDGNINSVQKKLFDDWRLFNFSLIRIELLSEIYEIFLDEFDKRTSGTYYTPYTLVELVLNNVLPNSDGNLDYNKKILDPACGSGIFLTLAYKRLVYRWKKATGKDSNFSDLSKLLIDNIFGIELNKKSIRVAAFSLYLSLLDFLDPKDVWLDKDKQFPFLIFDKESENPDDIKGQNLFRTDTIIEKAEYENINFDIIIGNPPFGTKNLPSNIKNYCKKFSFDKQYVIPFIHKSSKLTLNGQIALLFNTHILTYPKKEIEAFREWLFKCNHVSKIYNLSIFRNATNNFGGNLFASAKVPVSIVFFSPKNIEKSYNVEYWAPKTFIKNNVIDGVIIDRTDVKYIPIELCIQKGNNIWKIAHWGTLTDFFLINEIRKTNTTLRDLELSDDIQIKAGLHAPEKNKVTQQVIGDFLDIRNIKHYYTPQKNISKINSNFRKFDMDLFDPPFIGLPQNIMDRKICASFFDKKVYFKSGIFLLKTKSTPQLKNYTILLNSTLSNYYFFLTSGCWGIERDQLFLTSEYKTFPISLKFINQKINVDFSKLIYNRNILTFQESYNKYFDRNEYDKLIYDAYFLDKKQIAIIEDFVTYSIDLFYKKENSIALKPVNPRNPETISFAELICSEINDFFKIDYFIVNARVYNVSIYAPLCMVVLHFSDSKTPTHPKLITADAEFNNSLSKVEKYTLDQYSQNIYVRKEVRYYEHDTIFLVKPNQKRFWSRSQALDDAHTIINELIAMDHEE